MRSNKPATTQTLIENRGGRLVVGGTAIPERDEIERLCSRADIHRAELAPAIVETERRIRTAVSAQDWRTVDTKELIETLYWALVLDTCAGDVGGHARLLSALLLRGIAEGCGLRPFAVVAYCREILPAVSAEADRRGAAHPAGIAAVALAVAMELGAENKPEVEEAIVQLSSRIRPPRHIPSAPDQTPGQILLTVCKEVDASEFLRAIAGALDGAMDFIPASVVRDLQDEDRADRRRLPRPEQIVDLEVEGPADFQPDKLALANKVIRAVEAAEQFPRALASGASSPSGMICGAESGPTAVTASPRSGRPFFDAPLSFRAPSRRLIR